MSESYFDALCGAMKLLAEQPNALFMGQAVAYPGTAMYKTLRDVPLSQRLELPVVEDMQLGMATGLALQGVLPICLYPRINFLLLAVNQLVLHLDKLSVYSRGGYKPKVIIRTAIATPYPLNPGVQHLGNFVSSLRSMLSTVVVKELLEAQEILPAYREALLREQSTLLVEHTSLYA